MKLIDKNTLKNNHSTFSYKDILYLEKTVLLIIKEIEKREQRVKYLSLENRKKYRKRGLRNERK